MKKKIKGFFKGLGRKKEDQKPGPEKEVEKEGAKVEDQAGSPKKSKRTRPREASIGIDLGDKYIKLSYVDEENPVFALANERYRVDHDLDLNQYFKLVNKSIKAFLKANKIKRASLNFIIPSDNKYLLANAFTMEDIEDSLLEDSIIYNLEGIMPIEPNKYIHRYVKLGQLEGSDEIRVISVMLSKKLKEKIIELKRPSWRINKLIPQFLLGQNINRQEVVVIDFGYESSRIYLYRDEEIRDIETIDIGSRAFLEKTIEILGIGEDEAEEILRDGDIIRPFVDNGGGQLYINTEDHSIDLNESLREVTLEMSDKIKRCIRVMELNNNTIMNEFFYTGGIAHLDEFIRFLTRDLDANFRPLNIFEIKGLRNLNYEEDLDFPYEFKREEPEAYLYSMLGTRSLETSFNFIDDVRFFIHKTALLAGVVCASLFLNLGIYLVNQQYDKKIRSASSNLDAISGANQEIVSEMEDLNSNISRNSVIIDRVENLKAKKEWLSDILYILPQETPTNVGIHLMEIEGRHAILRGYSQDYSSIGYLAMALEHYGEVNIYEVGEMEDQDLRVENQVKMRKEFIMDIEYEDRLVKD